MIEMLRQGKGHAYCGVQKERQTLGGFPFEEIIPLAELVEFKGVDQEAVTLSHQSLYEIHEGCLLEM